MNMQLQEHWETVYQKNHLKFYFFVALVTNK